MQCLAELPGLLSECGLRNKLLSLQILYAILHLSNLAFVYFEGWLSRHGGRYRFGGRRRLLATSQPHDGDHQECQSDEKPRLDVFGEKALRFCHFFLNLKRLGRLAHRSLLSSPERDAQTRCSFCRGRDNPCR